MVQNTPNMAQNPPTAYSSPLLLANDAVGVPPIAVGGGSGYPASNPAAAQQQRYPAAQQQRQQQPPGGFSSELVSPRAAKDTRSYQAQLLEQMREKEMKKQKEKAERERYEAKLEAEAANYNPWGKGGAGAPMRDQTGNIVADLKQLHNRNEQIQQSPRDPKLQLFSELGGLSPPTNPAAAVGGGLSPRVEAAPAFAAPTETSKFARGRGNLEPENKQQGNTSDYKEMLRQQVEEKKRREAEEKEKQRLEDEKEEKRLAAQRERMQKEFEAEQERQRIKNEEKEKQQKELERQLQEKQEAAEQRRKQQYEARQKREQEEDDKKRQLAAGETNRAAVASPPIPTHQTNQRSDSPPIPALRSNEQRGSSPPIPTLRKDKPPQEFPSERPKSRALKPAASEEEERRAKTPEVPQAAGSRDPRDVVRALSAMRNQLAVEQRRIQNQLDKHYDPHSQPNNTGAKKGTRSPQVDVFELARNKQKATVHREPLNRPAAHEFNSLKNRGTQSRQRLRDQYPTDPNSDISLEAQQRALLRNQQQRLEDMRKTQASEKDKYSSMPGMRPNDFKSHDAPSLQLDSESAFIGINSGETKMPDDVIVPKPFVPGNSKPPPDPLGSLASFDSTTLDYLANKSKERNRTLRALEPDRDSLAEADDILERFMVRGSHDRPLNSRVSDDLSVWMRPSDDNYEDLGL